MGDEYTKPEMAVGLRDILVGLENEEQVNSDAKEEVLEDLNLLI